ncbi:MAG: polymerase, sigma-24 subunit, subfamily [Conexibacter sp.]|nr:polymerase, sigma-24 subunit, subfamily [Conexibacter sp.]
MSRPPKHSEPFHPGSKFLSQSELDWEQTAAHCLREARRIAAPHDAADIAQEAMIRVWRSLRDGAVPDHPIAWLRTIVHREACRHHGRNAAALSLDEHGDIDDRAATGRLDLLPLQVDVRRAVRNLTPQDRKLLALRYVDDLTQPAVALALGIPEGTAKVRLHRARGRLQHFLNEHEGGDCR